MQWIVDNLWLIPVLPLLAAGVQALLGRRQRRISAGLAIGALSGSLVLSLCAFYATWGTSAHDTVWRSTTNFEWFQFGETALRLGWMLDPLTAIMLVMVTLVSLLIFIYSIGYMAHDENFTRFFCFLSLFAAAMLGIVIANSLLLLFISWELVGLASYLLIGFWFHKPSAAAAAKKAFITTRVGDVGFLLGMVWLYARTGTLLFYDQGEGCLESRAISALAAVSLGGHFTLATAISLLIFCGAMGKSGQVPLHVWLPDAMEGPTPVSALIHAATMVAAGVFLMARIFPLVDADPLMREGLSSALTVIAWVGAITAVFAAVIAVAQNDIKRILAYSTVSQLGYMMMALGVGSWVAAMFHLITHAFFKALLFLGAGSVIHGCHEQQDIRHMGGIRKYMPLTFGTYAVGMMALSGVPFFFSGFWSKDEILHQAMLWPISRGPFVIGLIGAMLTAFYMTRQMIYVFGGDYRGGSTPTDSHSAAHASLPHESPAVMTIPLILLAVGAVLLGFLGTPVWPWFHGYLTGHEDEAGFAALLHPGILPLMFLSVVVVGTGLGLGWAGYGRRIIRSAADPDALEVAQPVLFNWLRQRLFVDELYQQTVIAWNASCARACDWWDRFIWENCVQAVRYFTVGCSWLSRLMDDYVVNLGFDAGCEGIRNSSSWLSRLQNGQIQFYLRAMVGALIVLLLLLVWGGWS
jgi:NADH-quinone oxidoreductase subunit L